MKTKTSTKQKTTNSVKPDVIRRFRAVEKAYALLLDKKYGWLSLSNKIEELGEALGIETF
jgi:muconolactone delta-isomerase